jgi:hypothetical protein
VFNNYSCAYEAVFFNPCSDNYLLCSLKKATNITLQNIQVPINVHLCSSRGFAS